MRRSRQAPERAEETPRRTAARSGSDRLSGPIDVREDAQIRAEGMAPLRALDAPFSYAGMTCQLGGGVAMTGVAVGVVPFISQIAAAPF